MVLLRLLAACWCLALLLPARAAAASAEQLCPPVAELPPEIRGPFVAAHLSLSPIPPVEVAIENLDQPLTLQICAPDEESGTALVKLKLLEQALPSLSGHAGLPYHGSLARTIVLAPVAELRAIGEGGMIDSRGVIYLHPTSPARTVVREAAHYWIAEEHFAEPWIEDGYAGHLAELTMHDLGIDESQGDARCDDVSLLTWRAGPASTAMCGYVMGATIFHELAQMVGEKPLQQTLARLSDGSNRIDSWKLLTRLEHAGDRDLTPIMKHYVFPPEYDPFLDERSALRQKLRAARALATSLGADLSPAIDTALDSWNFGVAKTWLSPLLPLLEYASEIEAHCARMELNCAHPWRPLPADPAALQPLAEQLVKAKVLLDSYAALDDSRRAQGLAAPPSLVAAVSALRADDNTREQVRSAAEILSWGSALERTCEEDGISCCADWRALWSAENMEGARQSLHRLARVLQRAPQQETYCTTAGWPCGAGWHTALCAGGTPAAQTYMDQANALLPQLAWANKHFKTPTTTLAAPIAMLFGLSPADPLAGARGAFDEGQLDSALELANRALYARAVAENLRDALPFLALLTMVMLASIAFGLRTQARGAPLRAEGIAPPADPFTIAPGLRAQARGVPSRTNGITPLDDRCMHAVGDSVDLLSDLLAQPLEDECKMQNAKCRT